MVCVEQTCHQGSMCRCEVHPGAYRKHKDHEQHNKWHSTGRMQRSAQHKLWAIRSGYELVQHILSSIWRDRKNKEEKKRYQQIGNERKLWVQEKVKTVGSRPWQYHLNRATEQSRMCKWKKTKHNPPVVLGSTQMQLQNPAVIIHKWKKETTYSERFVFIIWGLLFLFSNIFFINSICTCHIPLFASEMFSSSLLPLEYKPHPLKSSLVSSSSSETCALLVVVAFN